jgi:hypothetical protein
MQPLSLVENFDRRCTSSFDVDAKNVLGHGTFGNVAERMHAISQLTSTMPETARMNESQIIQAVNAKILATQPKQSPVFASHAKLNEKSEEKKPKTQTPKKNLSTANDKNTCGRWKKLNVKELRDKLRNLSTAIPGLSKLRRAELCALANKHFP